MVSHQNLKAFGGSNQVNLSKFSGETQHAEAVQIEFDPKIEMLGRVNAGPSGLFPALIKRDTDPAVEYRGAETAKRVTEEVQSKHFNRKSTKIVTTSNTAGLWWDAEAYHQVYFFTNSNGYQRQCFGVQGGLD
ncbi:hypothetical protein B0H13DRAFT_1911193 [Mycena leptocephala]|nr:hypothetical protein B0H13DRAFT_1911193 [Mycena leptocephala]